MTSWLGGVGLLWACLSILLAPVVGRWLRFRQPPEMSVGSEDEE